MAKKKSKQTKVSKKTAPKTSKKVTKQVPVEAPKKKKKKHTGLKVFAILMTIFVVFPIAFVFIAFFDTSTKKVSAKDIHYENLVSQTFYNAVSSLGEAGTLDFTINEEMFDGIMMAACDKINQKQFIPKMYCYIHKNNYTFVVDLQASFFKTRVQLQTTLKEDDENILYFRINQIVIGRLPIPVNWITGIAGNFIKDDMLNSVFEQSGFRIKSNLAKAQLTYARQDFKEDVGKYVEKLGNNNEYLKFILDVVGDNASELLKTTYEGGVTALIDLTKLTMPTAEPKFPLNLTAELNKHKVKVTEWLNAGILEENRVADVFSYLIRGYDLSNGTAQGFIDTISQEALQPSPLCEAITEYIGNPKDYKGSKVNNAQDSFYAYCGGDENENIKVGFTPNVTTSPWSLDVTLNENDLNKYLTNKMSDAIGTTIPITYKDADNKWGFEYIVIDNFFVDFEQIQNKAKMNIYLSLNVAGLPLCLKITNGDIKIRDATPGDVAPSLGKLSFNLEDISFGLISLKGTGLLETILKMIPSDETFVYVKDDTNEYFAIDLDKVSQEAITDEIKSKVAEVIQGNDFTCSVPVGSEDTLNLSYTYTPQP